MTSITAISPKNTCSTAVPHLRILIADNQHTQRVLIEKCLNALGQYRVAPVASFEELEQLTHSPALEFDLLIINCQLARNEGVDAAGFCLRSTSVRNALVYGDDYLLLRDGSPTEQRGTLAVAKYPDLHVLKRICMAIIAE